MLTNQQTPIKPETEVEDLDQWLNDFVAKPQSDKIRRESYKEPKPKRTLTVVAPAVADALVLFSKLVTCGFCKSHLEPTPMFLGLRRPIKGGHSYLAYTPDMAAIAANLPRLEVYVEERSPACHLCFGGHTVNDDDQREFHSVSRVMPDEDMSLFVRNAASLRREESIAKVDNLPGD